MDYNITVFYTYKYTILQFTCYNPINRLVILFGNIYSLL